ncbi:putative Chalcone isomerase [Thiomonas sp. X19]|uniref:chalcone isomerase family protein n=1 Tax=Thiomonas sp. X19 TaxID=1050370 RepID=UPI000B6C0288|nr:chalcone isomerase family protein [Thiomonas sp. X19]SCC91574.1 putative Chalcone isomerase [Thiomonas sp. X19]
MTARRLAPRFFAAALFAVTLQIVTLQAAHALEIHGVPVDETRQLAGKTLPLNGVGTRYFLFFKVYVAALYLPQKTSNAQMALDMPGPKEMRLVMLRDVTGSELGKKLTEGIQNNVSAEEFSGLIPSMARLGGLFAQKRNLKTGEVVTLRFVPDHGTTIDIDGVPAGAPYTDPDFFKALLKIWLGKDPAETRLKSALLGDAAVSQ